MRTTGRSRNCEQLVQMQMHRSEVTAIVAGRDAEDARPARGADADAGRFLDGGLIDAVDDDFVDGIDPFGQGGFHHAAQGGAISVVGAGTQFLVATADLAAGADNAAGKWKNDAGELPNRGDSGFCGRQPFGLARRQKQEIPARNALDGAENIFTREFTVHHRQTPVASALQFFAELIAVAEETKIAADLDRLVLDDREAIVARGGGTGENTLDDAIDG